MSKLVWRTPVGGVSIPPAEAKKLGVLDVNIFSKIRVVAKERAGSPSPIQIQLVITEGGEPLFPLDTFGLSLTSGVSQLSRTYDVPPAKLIIEAFAAASPAGLTGTDIIDVFIYGS